MTHKRFKFKATLCGSSDFRRVKAARLVLQENHKNFNLMSFKTNTIEVEVEIPNDDVDVIVVIQGKSMTVPYKVARDAKYKWYKK